MEVKMKDRDRVDILQQYVSDMLALERHIHEAVSRQKHDATVQKHPQASSLINRIEETLDEHIEHLEQHIELLGGEVTKPIKDAVSAVAGVAAGLYDKVRSEQISKMLRDDYTALGLAAISYTMLHTTGLAMGDPRTADIALRHLTHWTPLITEISEVIPSVVTKELADNGATVSPTITQEAVRNTQHAWSREVIR
jgi:ferritin-like metal-binding protein YciE